MIIQILERVKKDGCLCRSSEMGEISNSYVMAATAPGLTCARCDTPQKICFFICIVFNTYPETGRSAPEGESGGASRGSRERSDLRGEVRGWVRKKAREVPGRERRSRVTRYPGGTNKRGSEQKSNAVSFSSRLPLFLRPLFLRRQAAVRPGAPRQALRRARSTRRFQT